MGKAFAPMTTNRTLRSFNDLSSPSVSISPAQEDHLAALAKHHFKAFLSRQGRQIVQLELDLRTLVVLSAFQNSHRIHLDQLRHTATARSPDSTTAKRLMQEPKPIIN